MLAATEAVDLARLFLDLLIVVVAAKVAAEAVERIGIPAVLGEIVAGIVIGPSALGVVELTGERGVSLGVMAEIGVLLLLVQVGMEMDLAELGRVGRASLVVAIIGVVVPFATGMGAGLALGEPGETALFLGAALTATSVGITARVFGDLRALATTEARVVLGAAVADDVLGLIILTVIVKVVTGGGVTVGSVASTIAAAVGFLVLAGVAAVFVVPRLLDVIHRTARSGTTLATAALALVVGLALLADVAQLAFIIGAFMAGLALGRSAHQERLAADLHSVGGIFIPIFFVLIGVNADLGAMLRPAVLFDAAVLLGIAVVGKLVSAYGAVGIHSDRLLIGIGMIPRGEVGLIFASIGLAEGVLDDELYGALLVVVLLSTVVTPPLLRWRISGTAARGPDDESVDAEPERGWVVRVDDEIVLTARPPATDVAQVALQAAALADHGHPSSSLLDWLSERRGVEIAWTADDTDALLRIVRRGHPRSIRFLDATGVLERGVPTIATALARRRGDPTELDPVRVLRFPTVARVEQLLADSAVEPDADRLGPLTTLTLAALATDVLGPDAGDGPVRALLDELAVERPGDVVHLLGSTDLLQAAAADLDGYGPVQVRHLATHMATAATASGAYLLAVASDLDHRHRDGLDELDRLVSDLLRHPDILGSGAVDLADDRRSRAAALVDEPAAIERLHGAPIDYLLAHEPDELARQARLVEPLPPNGTVRVAVSPDREPDHWLVDVACRDRAGLLARLSRSLTD
ncbi:MAG: cation:proton antiporter, partial [Acidimicrobiia bacterium]|nr:cation:proton antiporter [Acidimicrobiia bacterium]